jgi:hypothetical protein
MLTDVVHVKQWHREHVKAACTSLTQLWLEFAFVSLFTAPKGAGLAQAV